MRKTVLRAGLITASVATLFSITAAQASASMYWYDTDEYFEGSSAAMADNRCIAAGLYDEAVGRAVAYQCVYQDWGLYKLYEAVSSS